MYLIDILSKDIKGCPLFLEGRERDYGQLSGCDNPAALLAITSRNADLFIAIKFISRYFALYIIVPDERVGIWLEARKYFMIIGVDSDWVHLNLAKCKSKIGINDECVIIVLLS